ncbi:MAG: chloride channel protein [Dehalococcoidia bacterium]
MTNQEVVRALWLGILIGIVAGAGAILFTESIAFVGDHMLGTLAGFYPPNPLGEGSQEYSGPTRRWALPLVLGLGGLLSGILVFTFAPEAEGHGTDAAIDSFHNKGGRARWQVIPIKLLASALTIGSGGAAGREGPTAQIGGTFGSVLADRLGLDPAERRRALAAGMGAGIGAIFRAPLGGAMMGAEVLYVHDFESDVILLGLISSIVGYSIFGSYYSFEPMFGNTGGFTFSNVSEIPYYCVLGAACGLMGLLYVKSFYGTTALFHKMPFPRILKPMVGGIAAGIIGFAAPESIHVGYGWVQRAFDPNEVLSLSPWLLLLLPFARIMTTSLTVGSGGSGGIFGPGMVIGGLVGAAAWRVGHGLPGFPEDPAPIIIICMIAMFGSVAHAPLAMLLMVGEMTGNLSLLAPAMAAVAIATLLVGDTTIYKSQQMTRADSPAHRHRFSFPLLSALPVQRAMRKVSVFEPDTSPKRVLEALELAREQFAVIEIGNGKFSEVNQSELRAAVEANQPTVGEICRPIPTTISSDVTLDVALDLLTANERRWLPITEGKRVLGVVDGADLLRSYRRAVGQQIRPLTALDSDLAALEVVIPATSPIAGRQLLDSGLPQGVRVLLVERNEETSVPDGTWKLTPGDKITVSVPASMRAATFESLFGAPE